MNLNLIIKIAETVSIRETWSLQKPALRKEIAYALIADVRILAVNRKIVVGLEQGSVHGRNVHEMLMLQRFRKARLNVLE
jgi:hypothetical protein